MVGSWSEVSQRGLKKTLLCRQNLSVRRQQITKYLNRLFRVETNGETTVLRYVRVEFPTETRHGLNSTRNSNGQQAQRRCPLTTVKPPRCFGLPFVRSHHFLSPILCMHLSDGSRSDTSREHPFVKDPRTPTMPPCVHNSALMHGFVGAHN